MKSFDPVSQRIISVCLGVSLVLFAASVFVFSIANVQNATAAPNLKEAVAMESAPWDGSVRGSVGLGIVNNTGYFVVYSNPNVLYKVDLSKARNWYDD